MKRVHFIGIGGVGMNGVAQLSALSEYRVSGSDRAYTPDQPPYNILESLGITIHPQDGSGMSAETDAVIFSTAIEENNPDLKQAHALNIPLLHRAVFLQELIGERPLIAVAGTAGKSTTTALLGWIFESLDLDPSVYNGAAILNWRSNRVIGNVRLGKGPWIIEADESDRSLLHFHPSHSLITNISRDHYELDELHALFDEFESQTSGQTLRGPFPAPSEHPKTRLIGKHNMENVLAAWHLCQALDLDMEKVAQAIALFEGVERRLERVGSVNGITIIDDYAHNPAKIRAALQAVAEQFETVHAYWRPHGFGPLQQHQEALIDVFKTMPAKTIHILPVYYAGGTVERSITSEGFVEACRKRGVQACYAPDYDTLKERLEAAASSGDAILGMGARDPELPRFAQRLIK